MAKTIIRANQYLEAPITDPKHLVNKEYVDDLLERNLKQPVRLATTENLAGTYNSTTQRLTGRTLKWLEIDGVKIDNEDRILVKDQLDKTQNGIYIVINTGSATTFPILERSSDFNASNKIPKNLFVRVSEGNTQADTLFQLVNDEEIILDTTPIIFSPYRASGDSVNKSSVSITGNGVQTDFNILHNLRSEDVMIIVKNGNDVILTNWEIVDPNSLKITFDTPLENGIELKVIVFG